MHVVDAPEDDRDSSSMAKIVAEIQIDLASYVGLGNVSLNYVLEGHMAPPSSSIDCIVNVSLQERTSPLTK